MSAQHWVVVAAAAAETSPYLPEEDSSPSLTVSLSLPPSVPQIQWQERNSGGGGGGWGCGGVTQLPDKIGWHTGLAKAYCNSAIITQIHL